MKKNLIHKDNMKNIKIEGHRGTWYVVNYRVTATGVLYLLEHETYGDEAPSLIVNEMGKVLMEDVWDGFSDWDSEHRF